MSDNEIEMIVKNSDHKAYQMEILKYYKIKFTCKVDRARQMKFLRFEVVRMQKMLFQNSDSYNENIG